MSLLLQCNLYKNKDHVLHVSNNKNAEISFRPVNRTLHRHHYHPCKVQMHQEPLPEHFARRQEVCHCRVSNRLYEYENFSCYVIVTNEATFLRNGSMSRHNFHYYDTSDDPHRLLQTQSQFCCSLNIWELIPILGYRVVGPVFLIYL